MQIQAPERILQVVTIMNRGGLETMIMNYYRNIDRNKIQFDFLVHRSEKGDFDDEILSLGGTIFTVLPLSFKGYFAYLKSLDFFFSNHNHYKVVHVHNNAFGYFPIKAAAKYLIPTRIIHSHVSNVTEISIKLLIGNYLKKKFPKYATNFLACSQSAGEWMYGKNINFEVLNNSIDSQNFKYNPIKSIQTREILNASKTINIVNVGRFHSSKNHTFLLDIFYEFLKLEPNSKLFLIGQGELKKDLEEKIIKLNINEKVFFLGLRSDVNEVLQAMDIFLFPSHYEGLPVSLIEAQASGLNCITSTGVPVQSAIIPNLVKFISLKKSASEWAKVVFEKSNYKREDTSRLISKSGFDVVENAKWLEKYYYQSLSNKIS